MKELRHIALSRHTFGEGLFAGVHPVPHPEAARAGAAPTERTAIHLASVVEPGDYNL